MRRSERKDTRGIETNGENAAKPSEKREREKFLSGFSGLVPNEKPREPKSPLEIFLTRKLALEENKFPSLCLLSQFRSHKVRVGPLILLLLRERKER